MKKLLAAVALLVLSNQIIAQNKKSEPASKVKPLTIGVVEVLQSKVLAEKRVLNIYLPTGYNPKDTVKYPVIYLLDGSVDEDFIHVVGLVQVNSFEWINRLPKSIVVGIATVDAAEISLFQLLSNQTNKPTLLPGTLTGLSLL